MKRMGCYRHSRVVGLLDDAGKDVVGEENRMGKRMRGSDSRGMLLVFRLRARHLADRHAWSKSRNGWEQSQACSANFLGSSDRPDRRAASSYV